MAMHRVAPGHVVRLTGQPPPELVWAGSGLNRWDVLCFDPETGEVIVLKPGQTSSDVGTALLSRDQYEPDDPDVFPGDTAGSNPHTAPGVSAGHTSAGERAPDSPAELSVPPHD